jgi:ABC-2 type transport system permease protein
MVGQPGFFDEDERKGCRRRVIRCSGWRGSSISKYFAAMWKPHCRARIGPRALAFTILAGMALGLFVLALWLLRRLSSEFLPEEEAPMPQDGRGIGGAFIGEWRRVLADRGVFSLLIVAPVFYGVFYPQPYLGQLVRKIPIAVVDDDRTVLSRRLIQALDADEAISVAVRAPALDVAQQALFDRRVFGILEIPPDTEREVLKGNKARIPAYVDSAYFLVFNRTLQGIGEGAGDTNVADISHGLRMDGAQARLALTALSPAELLMEPLYNPTGGYASYVVPAAFVLIIQQTLLMGAATLIALGFERRPGVRRTRLGPTGLFGRGLAHLTIYVAALALFFIVLPRVYGFSTLGRVADLALFAVPFVLATSFSWVRPRGAFSGTARRRFWSLSRRPCRNSFSSACPGHAR